MSRDHGKELDSCQAAERQVLGRIQICMCGLGGRVGAPRDRKTKSEEVEGQDGLGG